jgi:hypothetical protein
MNGTKSMPPTRSSGRRGRVYDPALFLPAIGWMLALFARTLSR